MYEVLCTACTYQAFLFSVLLNYKFYCKSKTFDMIDWFRKNQWRIELFIIILRLFTCFWSSGSFYISEIIYFSYHIVADPCPSHDFAFFFMNFINNKHWFRACFLIFIWSSHNYLNIFFYLNVIKFKYNNNQLNS